MFAAQLGPVYWENRNLITLLILALHPDRSWLSFQAGLLFGLSPSIWDLPLPVFKGSGKERMSCPVPMAKGLELSDVVIFSITVLEGRGQYSDWLSRISCPLLDLGMDGSIWTAWPESYQELWPGSFTEGRRNARWAVTQKSRAKIPVTGVRLFKLMGSVTEKRKGFRVTVILCLLLMYTGDQTCCLEMLSPYFYALFLIWNISFFSLF